MSFFKREKLEVVALEDINPWIREEIYPMVKREAKNAVLFKMADLEKREEKLNNAYNKLVRRHNQLFEAHKKLQDRHNDLCEAQNRLKPRVKEAEKNIEKKQKEKLEKFEKIEKVVEEKANKVKEGISEKEEEANKDIGLFKNTIEERVKELRECEELNEEGILEKLLELAKEQSDDYDVFYSHLRLLREESDKESFKSAYTKAINEFQKYQENNASEEYSVALYNSFLSLKNALLLDVESKPTTEHNTIIEEEKEQDKRGMLDRIRKRKKYRENMPHTKSLSSAESGGQ